MGKRMMPAVLALLCGIALLARQDAPNVFHMDPSTLLAVRESYGKPDGKFKPAIDTLLRDARAALKSEPVSVIQKTEIPPSGDKHDYMSVAPYWWPDPSKPGGVPYVRRDAERNPECDTLGDRRHEGRGIRKAIDYLLPYALGEKTWSAKQIVPMEHTQMVPILRYAALKHGDAKYK